MPVGRPIAEPSDDPRIQRRREKARIQARERAAVAKQLKAKFIPMDASLDRKQPRKSAVMKERDCEEQLEIVKKELKRKQAQIKFLAQNINKVDASASPVNGRASSVIVDKNKIDSLTSKADDIVNEDIDAVDTMGRMIKRTLARGTIDTLKKENKNVEVKNTMATKIQTAIRGKKSRIALGNKKYAKESEARYLKKLEDDKKAKGMTKPITTSEDRRKKDNAFGK